MLADVLDDGSCFMPGGFKSLGLSGSVGEVTSCKAHYPGGSTECDVSLVDENGYSYADFAFPVVLNSAGDTVKIELQYSLSNFACLTDDSDHWGFMEYTSNQWLRASMVRSTRYYICAEWLRSWHGQFSAGGGLTQLTPAEGECTCSFIRMTTSTDAL